MTEPVRVGVVGLGGFGQFVLAAFANTPEVQVVAVHDTDGERTHSVAEQHRVRACATYAELVELPEVEVVYLATPPAMHGAAVLEALRSGKHVWVEKPLATSEEEAVAIEAKVKERGLRVGIDYVLRFNPIYRLAGRLGRSGLLGDLRHMTLENDASDENLRPGHWFWDPGVSGTILVEHGVHFFDIAAQLAGAQGTCQYSQAWVRPPHGFIDRMLAAVRYGDVPAYFYHAFDKASRIERTEFRLAYDTGYITVKGWMPVELEVEAILNEEGIAQLQRAVEGGRLEVGAGRTAPITTVLEYVEPYFGDARRALGRERSLDVSHRVRMRVVCPEGKQAIYARAIEAGVADFARGLREPGYEPEVTLQQAIASLRIALAGREHAVRQEPALAKNLRNSHSS